MPGDYPDYTSPTVEGQTVELDPTFGQPHSFSDSAVINATAYHDFVFTIVGTEYIYRFDTLDIFCTTIQNHYTILYYGANPIGARTDSKSLHFTLKDNPSLVFIEGDTLTVRVYNINAAAQTFYVWCQGTKFLRPVGFGHPPIASFTALSLTPKVGDLVTFTDTSEKIPTSWDIDFGDLSAHSSLQSPTHQYNYVGSVTPVQIATNQYGFDICRRVAYITISPTEDFTGYTEVDVPNRVAVTASQLAVTNMQANENIRVYKDKGAGAINAFTVYFQFILSPSDAGMLAFLFGLSDSAIHLFAGSISYPAIHLQTVAGVIYMYVDVWNPITGLQAQTLQIVVGTMYYIKAVHAANSGTFTVYVYSDAKHSTLLSTLAVTDATIANKSWRYLYALNSNIYGDASKISYLIQNYSYLAV